MKTRSWWFGSLALACVAACSNSEPVPPGTSDSANPTLPGLGDGEKAGAAVGNSGSAPGVSGVRTAPAATPVIAGTASGAAPPSAAGGSASSSAAPLPAAGPSSGMSLPFAPPAGIPATGTATPPLPTSAVLPPGPLVPSQQQPAAGVLTAGTWDDNRNYERFKQYRGMLQQNSTPGLLPTNDAEHDSAHNEFSQPHGPRQTLDVALVIDTTGSMGDEISYLQREFLALSSAIEDKYPNSTQRWSLIVYRDTTDDYVVRWFDFRDDAMDFRDKLAMQAAGGGGDFPEAPDAALAAMVQLAWRTDKDTARLAFWVADAPHHNEKAEAMLAAIRAARSIDVHLYPVASSGINELTELTMRTAAQLTGGRYLFLTDDSQVGGGHKEPSVPCYFVTHLDKAILRMVAIELSGIYAEPDATDVLRTGGDPKAGACTLESGSTVQIF